MYIDSCESLCAIYLQTFLNFSMINSHHSVFLSYVLLLHGVFRL